MFLARLLIPAGLVFAVYLFWVGADAPGGKFQASTLVAALWLLAIMAGLAPAPRTGGGWTGIALAVGPLAFIAAGTIGIAAASPDHVLAWHNAGTAHGGTAIESPPSERPNGAFVAYLRDPDGNKLTARSQPTKQ